MSQQLQNLKFLFLILLILSINLLAFSQTPANKLQQSYPKVAGYIGLVHPLVSFTGNGAHFNFNNSYMAGVPVGINIWKSAKAGFSVEFVPFIQAEDGTSKMSNLLFHPGVLLPIGKGFTFIGRAAFETSGRYGFTPILNKVVKRNKNSNYFVAMPIPVRFGGNKSNSLGLAFQFGIGF